MYKKIIFTILFLGGTMIYGQSGQFFDAPFGGGIGYVPAWYVPNIDPINSQLNAIGMKELSSSGFYSSGIAGFVYVGLIKNLRVGAEWVMEDPQDLKKVVEYMVMETQAGL